MIGPATGASVTVIAVGKPAGAGSKTIGKSKAGRSYVRDDSGNAGREWRKTVKAAGVDAMAGRPPLEGPLIVTMRFYVPRGSTVTRRLPTVRPDVLKLARAAEDALTGIVWADDSQIVAELLLKAYGRPRVEITATLAGDA